MKRLAVVIGLGLTGLGISEANAADVACAPVMAAMEKTREAPVHQYQDRATGGKHHLSELIRTRDTIYLQVNGRWRRSVMTPQQSAKMEEDNIRERGGNTTCHKVRDETIGNDNATLYSADEKTDEDGVTTSELWISKRTGLIVKQVTHIDVGGGPAGKTDMTIRFDYDGVRAPQGVQ